MGKTWRSSAGKCGRHANVVVVKIVVVDVQARGAKVPNNSGKNLYRHPSISPGQEAAITAPFPCISSGDKNASLFLLKRCQHEVLPWMHTAGVRKPPAFRHHKKTNCFGWSIACNDPS